VILLTTSRRPTKRIRTFCHDFVLSVPNIIRINRGKLNLDGITEKAVELNANRIVVIDRWKAGPGKVKLFRIEHNGLISCPPLMHVSGVRLRREFKANTKHLRSLVVTIAQENHTETVRIAELLSGFFNLPRLSIDEAAAKYQVSMHLSLDASRHTQITFMFLPQMVEIGPRITLSKVVWKISL
jgi:U3 small nucleolar ribonucleoprotein protein IMP4